MKEKIESLAII